MTPPLERVKISFTKTPAEKKALQQAKLEWKTEQLTKHGPGYNKLFNKSPALKFGAI